MKKLMIIAAVAMVAFASQAAQIDWKYTGTSAQVGSTVYVILGTTAQAKWDSLAAIEAAAVQTGGSGEIKTSGMSKVANDTATDSKIGYTTASASYYYVLVSSDEKSYQVSTVVDGSTYAYDPGDPDHASSPGTQSTSNAAAGWTAAQSFDVPEPTSGLLLLLGVAGLALRRRRA